MYYYIFDSPKNYSENKTHERIKNNLTLLGISGETTIVSPARSATELTMMGIEKGYSTIIAIGSDEIINEVASNLAGTDTVFGIIPINASKEVGNIFGSFDINSACDALQKRRLEIINMGYLEPNVNFLTSIYIDSPNKPLSIQAEFDNYYLESSANKIRINNNLEVDLIQYEKPQGFFNQFFGINNREKKNNQSHFNVERIRLRTHEILPVKIGNMQIAKTPIVVYKRPQALKIIKHYAKLK